MRLGSVLCLEFSNLKEKLIPQYVSLHVHHTTNLSYIRHSSFIGPTVPDFPCFVEYLIVDTAMVAAMTICTSFSPVKELENE